MVSISQLLPPPSSPTPITTTTTTHLDPKTFLIISLEQEATLFLIPPHHQSGIGHLPFYISYNRAGAKRAREESEKERKGVE